MDIDTFPGYVLNVIKGLQHVYSSSCILRWNTPNVNLVLLIIAWWHQYTFKCKSQFKREYHSSFTNLSSCLLVFISQSLVICRKILLCFLNGRRKEFYINDFPSSNKLLTVMPFFFNSHRIYLTQQTYSFASSSSNFFSSTLFSQTNLKVRKQQITFIWNTQVQINVSHQPLSHFLPCPISVSASFSMFRRMWLLCYWEQQHLGSSFIRSFTVATFPQENQFQQLAGRSCNGAC